MIINSNIFTRYFIDCGLFGREQKFDQSTSPSKKLEMSTPPVNAVKISQPEDVSAASLDDAKISDFQDVASYNWLDEPTPTILVPGIFSTFCRQAVCPLD